MLSAIVIGAAILAIVAYALAVRIPRSTLAAIGEPVPLPPRYKHVTHSIPLYERVIDRG